MSFRYNQTSIDLLGQNFVEDFFREFDLYSKKYKSNDIFLNQNFENIEIKNGLDNYILKKYQDLDLSSYNDSKIKEAMDKYLKAFYFHFIKHPTELMGSPLLKKSSIVDVLCPDIKNDKNQSLRDIVKKVYIKNNNLEEIKKLCIKDRNTNSLTEEEINRLMNYFIKNLNTTDKDLADWQEKYIKKLIQEDKKTSDMSIKQLEFLATYTNNWMINSSSFKGKITNEIFVGEERASLGGFNVENLIYLNKNSALTDSIPSFIQTVCHETEHAIQQYEAINNPESKVGLDFAISKILREKYKNDGFNIYDANYRFEEIEKDAEIKGYWNASVFLRLMGFNDKASKLHNFGHKEKKDRCYEYDFRKHFDHKSTRDTFLFNSLGECIKKNPNLIKIYPSLALLFKNDGNVRSFEEIISTDYKVNNEAKSVVLSDFCRYYIAHGSLEKLDFSKFTVEEQTNIASRLTSLLIDESSLVSDMSNMDEKIKNSIDPQNRKHVEFHCLCISKNIMTFMNKNYNYLKEQNKKENFSSMIDMEYYESTAGKFKNDSMYNGLTYNSPEVFEELKNLSLETSNLKTQWHQKDKIVQGILQKQIKVKEMQSQLDRLNQVKEEQNGR